MARGARGETLRVEGLRDLQRAFALADKDVRKGFGKSLREAGEPVRADAQHAAATRIRNMSVPWSRMRVGSTAVGVYIAPVKRASRGRGNLRRRPNLADLLMGRAMLPALESNQPQVVQRVERLLGEMSRDWESVG